MFKVVSRKGFLPVLYDKEENLMRCNFCDGVLHLEKSMPMPLIPYVCPLCASKMAEKFQFSLQNYEAWPFEARDFVDQELSSGKFQFVDERLLFDLNEFMSVTCVLCVKKVYLRNTVKNSDFTICKDCAKELPGFDENISDSDFYVFACEKHSFYACSSDNGSCPLCEVTSHTCENKLSEYRASSFTHETNGLILLPIVSAIINEGEENIVDKKCSVCLRKFSTTNSSDDWCGRCFKICSCDTCGEEFAKNPTEGSSSDICEICIEKDADKI